MVHDSHGDHHRRKVIHIVGCGDAERSMDFEAKKDEGPEMTKGSFVPSFGTENNQEINMQGRPFQRSLNGVTGGPFSIFSRK